MCVDFLVQKLQFHIYFEIMKKKSKSRILANIFSTALTTQVSEKIQITLASLNVSYTCSITLVVRISNVKNEFMQL